MFSQIARNPLSRTSVSDVFALEFRIRDESRSGEDTHESYLISQYMAGSQSAIGAIKARAEKEYDLHLLPWTSIAARLDAKNENVRFPLLFLTDSKPFFFISFSPSRVSRCASVTGRGGC